jgi:hypothetical protein
MAAHSVRSMADGSFAALIPWFMGKRGKRLKAEGKDEKRETEDGR